AWPSVAGIIASGAPGDMGLSLPDLPVPGRPSCPPLALCHGPAPGAPSPVSEKPGRHAVCAGDAPARPPDGEPTAATPVDGPAASGVATSCPLPAPVPRSVTLTPVGAAPACGTGFAPEGFSATIHGCGLISSSSLGNSSTQSSSI